MWVPTSSIKGETSPSNFEKRLYFRLKLPRVQILTLFFLEELLIIKERALVLRNGCGIIHVLLLRVLGGAVILLPTSEHILKVHWLRLSTADTHHLMLHLLLS